MEQNTMGFKFLYKRNILTYMTQSIMMKLYRYELTMIT